MATLATASLAARSTGADCRRQMGGFRVELFFDDNDTAGTGN